MTPLTPGEVHPDYAELADTIRDADRDVVQVAVPPLLSGRWNPTDPCDPLEILIEQRTLHRERAWQSLHPDRGAYVWDVWVDDRGRQVAAAHARWEEHPQAWALDPYNPGETFHPDGRGGWLARSDCPMCLGSGVDYLGRPCRIHGGTDATTVTDYRGRTRRRPR